MPFIRIVNPYFENSKRKLGRIRDGDHRRCKLFRLKNLPTENTICSRVQKYIGDPRCRKIQTIGVPPNKITWRSLLYSFHNKVEIITIRSIIGMEAA